MIYDVQKCYINNNVTIRIIVFFFRVLHACCSQTSRAFPGQVRAYSRCEREREKNKIQHLARVPCDVCVRIIENGCDCEKHENCKLLENYAPRFNRDFPPNVVA